MCKEVIIIFDILTTFSCPLHIFVFASKIIPIIHQAKYKFHSIFACLWYHKIQCLCTNVNSQRKLNSVSKIENDEKHIWNDYTFSKFVKKIEQVFKLEVNII